MWVFLVSLLSLLPGASAYSATPTFLEANEAFENGDLKNAERLYQKVIREKPSFELVADAATNLGSVLLELNRVGDALDYFELAIKTNPTASDAHFNRGVVLQDIERLPEAIESYLAASAIDPYHAGALSNLASAYHAQGNHKAAARAYETAIIVAADAPDYDGEERRSILITLHYALGSVLDALAIVERCSDCSSRAILAHQQVLALDPNHVLAQHAVSAHRGDRASTGAPREYVEALFDDFAAKFDDSLRDLGYKAPELLSGALKKVLEMNHGISLPLKSVVDAGCGTGLLGPLIRGLTDSLIGVDLSSKMVKKAAGRGIYDELVVGDIGELLSESRFLGNTNLVAAADVLVYMGDLSSLFRRVSASLVPGGLFAFTVERSLTGLDSWSLLTSGRYSHLPAYISTLADAHGFDEVASSEIVPRFELGKPIPGQLYILKLRSPRN